MNDNPSHNTNEPLDAFGAQLNRKARPAKRRSKWARFFTFSGLALLMFIGAAAVYLTQTKNGKATLALFGDVPTAIKVQQNPDLLFDDVGSNIVNILLIGRDVNYKIIFKNGKPIAHVPDEDAPARSDTMILLSLNRAQRSLHMVSFPRDALVHMPPNEYGVRVTKLNAAHAYGGPEMLKQALREDLGITVHRFAVIRFDGFKALIDQVGGVEVDVIGALKRDGTRGDLDYDDNWGGLHIHLKPGMQHLDGTQAHDYVRFRMDLEGDPGRIRRQQQVLRALGKKMAHQPIYRIPGLVQEVRRQFETDMSDEEVASAAFFARSLGNAADITPITLFGIYDRRGSIILNRSRNMQLLSFLLGNTFDPSTFLLNSPSTERDDIGHQNDANPAAKALLHAAGVIDEDGNAINPKATSRRVRTRQRRNEGESEAFYQPSSTARMAEVPAPRVVDEEKPAPRKKRPRPKASAEPRGSSVSDSASTTTHGDADPIRHNDPVRSLSVDSISPVPQPE